MQWLLQACGGDRYLSAANVQADGNWLMCASFVAFCTLYATSMIVSQAFRTYRRLSSREKVFWHLAIVRASFGLFGPYCGVYIIIFEDEITSDIVFGSTASSHFLAFVMTGFFAFECLMLFGSNIYFRFVDWNLAAHHVLALLNAILTVSYGCGHFNAAIAMILEMTTPCSALCWMLLKAKRADTKLWRANQQVLVHLFHTRTNLELYVWYMAIRSWPHVMKNLPVVMQVISYGSLVIINFYLTPFWTYKKTWQLFNPMDWNHTNVDKKKN